MPDSPTDLIKITEAAKTVDVNRATIFRWIAQGRLRSWQLGGQRRVSRGELLEMLQEMRVPTKPFVRVRTANDELTRKTLIDAGLIQP